MEYKRDELKKLYENSMLNCNDNGAIIINYATLCSTQDEYTKAIRYLKKLANNIDNYKFNCDGILREKYPSTIPLFFWKYLTVSLIQNLSTRLIKENGIFTNDYDLDINYLLPIVMNVMHLYADGSFKPKNPVTKAEFVKIAISIIQELSISLEKIEYLKGIDEFKDVIGHWCEGYIRVALRVGILDLNNEELFYPDKTIIGAEAVEILRKIIYLDKTRKYQASVNEEFDDDRCIFTYDQQILEKPVTREIATQLIEKFCIVYCENLLINKQTNGFLINPYVQVLVFFIKMYEDNNCLKSSLLLMNVLYENFLEEFKKIEPEKAYIYSLIINLPDKQKLIVYKHLSKISSSIIKIKESLFVNTNQEIKIAHYTSIQTLKALTIDKSKFRLSNVEYLNDPSEGVLFKELLKKHWEQYDFIKGMDCFKEVSDKSCMINNTYIASFMDNNDNLPLWIHYGDRAEGCSIIFNKDLFSNENTIFLDQMSGKYSLYKVLYISKGIEDIGKSNIKQLNFIRKELNDCFIKEDANCQRIVFSFADMMVEQIAYLFKDKSYQYENEMRIVGFSQLADAKSFYYGNEVFPRIVLDMEQSINIDEIVFGPKVTRVNEKALALLKFNAVTDINKIRKSEIEYK